MKTDTDILVIGAGPAGLSFCKSLAGTGVRITVIEKNSRATLENPPPDGREIALTHISKEILKDLGAWDYLDDEDKYFLREAKVVNGTSPYTLHFPTPDKALGRPADTLGYLISNHNIRKSLYAQCKNQDNLTLITDTVVTTLTSNDDCATVCLSDGRSITAQLVVAADSRFSNTRRQMGISTEMNDFGRTVIVFRMKHTLSNENTATECFHYGRTLAVLPLTEKLSSMVITVDSSKAQALFDMDAEATRVDMMDQLDGKLGDMELVGDKHRYPLVGVHARRFYAKRYALIGDAAVGMHPVTAHGFNLGLQSQSILSNLIKEAVRKGSDIGASTLLETYSRQHMLHTFPLYHGTNAIVKLYTTENPPAKLLRHAGIHAGNLFMPFKKLISKQLTG
ncbi:MAG: ubiquinone biosynthesis protein UbiH [Gammaproteobacteria bacterium]|nr:MAG: ubiquinone biosynthesis protein UbiH [Gammaproteobacteria bacterium]